MQLARGKYVWIAESDDCADPHLLEVLVGRLASDPSAVLAYCQSQRINEDDLIECVLEERRVGLYPARWNNDYVNDGREECRQYKKLIVEKRRSQSALPLGATVP